MEKTYPMAMVTAPGKIEFQEKMLRRPSPNEVLIGVKACSICGTDLHILRGKHPSAPLPTAIGHELSGEVLSTGENVSKVKEGERVVVEPMITCGQCHFCRRGQYNFCTHLSLHYRKGQGGFAPYFIAQENWVYPLPENVSYEEGALIEPLSVALHAVKIGNLQPGQTVAIFGAGAIGLLVLLLTRLSGAGEVFIVDLSDFRLKKALEFGASDALNNGSVNVLDKIFEKTFQLGVDKAFEAVGLEPTLAQSLTVLKKGGTSVLVGIFEKQDVRIPANLFVQKEISLKGSQAYCWDFQTALTLLQQRNLRLKELITHIIPLSSLEKGFDLLMDPKNQTIKVIIKIE